MSPEIRELQARVQRLEADLMRRPIILPSPTVTQQYKQLRVGAGNTLATIDGVTFLGLKRANTLTSVPTPIPASITTACADGLSAAYDLGSNPIARRSSTLVWITAARIVTIQNPAGGSDTTAVNDYRFQIPENRLFFALDSFLVPVAGSPGVYAKVYIPAVVAG
jgi:hypothetical protein